MYSKSFVILCGCCCHRRRHRRRYFYCLSPQAHYRLLLRSLLILIKFCDCLYNRFHIICKQLLVPLLPLLLVHSQSLLWCRIEKFLNEIIQTHFHIHSTQNCKKITQIAIWIDNKLLLLTNWDCESVFNFVCYKLLAKYTKSHV